MNFIKNQVKKFFNSYQIFLLDGIGAGITFIFILFISKFETFFGVAQKISLQLAFIAFLFMIYSFSCYLLKPKNWKKCLNLIMIGNFFYSILTFLMIFFIYKQITLFGIFYFGGEILVIWILVYFEFLFKQNFQITK